MKAKITPELAELAGLHAGDGSMYLTTRGIVWELRGSLEEREFYDSYVKVLLEGLFQQNFQPKKRSGGENGCYGVRSSNNQPIPYLRSIGFRPGSKTHSVQIPSIIRVSNKVIKSAFLRGLFATDGTIYLARINGKSTPTYPMVELGTASQALRDQTCQILNSFNLKAYTWTYTPRTRGGPCHFLRLAGFTKTSEFARQIGFTNPKHQKRWIDAISFKYGFQVSKN